MDISAYWQEKHKRIETKLSELVQERNDLPTSELFRAARYALLGGGKRIRPILAIATAEVLGNSDQSCLTPACSLEMIHAYSLIHDDLPCMDDDNFRRGKPSTHKTFSEAHAVLAGDYLLTRAFEVLAEDQDLRAEQKITLISMLARHSGGDGMIGGQVMDIEAEGKPVTIEKLKNIHKHKTGAMITASILFGGVISKASPEEMRSLHQFGDYLGLAFQIIDDVLDVTASFKKHGKTASSDAINNKDTYVTLMGTAQAKEAAEDLYNLAIKELDNLKVDTSLLRELSKRLVYRDL